MKVSPLWKVCAENQIQSVFKKFGDQGEFMFQVGSSAYDLKKNWFVKGEYEIKDNYQKGERELHLNRLEEDIKVTINRPMVNGEKLPEEKELLQEMAEEVFTIAVFHRRSLNFAGKEIKRAHIPAFVEAVMESHYKRTGEKEDPKNFGVVRIDWKNKKVFIESISE